MSWKDLDIKQKAELIKLGVQSGIRDIKQIRQLYDDINTPTQVVDQSYNETNVKPLQGIERIVHDYGIPEEEVNKANDIIKQIENEISLEEINNQQPVQFRQFSKGGYISNNPTQSYSGGGPIKRKRENSLDWRMAVYNAVDPRTTVKNIDDAFRLYNAAVAKEKRGEDFKDYTLDNTIGDLTTDAAWRKRLQLPYDETLLPVWNGDTVSLSRPLELEIPIDTNLVKDRINYAKNEFWNDLKSLNLRQLKEDLSYKKSQEELLDALRYTYKTGKPIGVSEYHANSIDPEKVLKDFKYGISPLNVLGRYNIRYDKDENKMYYSDEWDFNQYEWAVPGTTFRIRGSIPLDKKKNGGKVKKYSKGGYENPDEPPVSESTSIVQRPLSLEELQFIKMQEQLGRVPTQSELIQDERSRQANLYSDAINTGIISEAKEDNIKNNFFRGYNNFRYSHPWAEALSYTPIIGDGMDLISLAKDINNKDYISAGLGLGIIALPNFIEKPLKKSNIKKLNTFRDYAEEQFSPQENFIRQMYSDELHGKGWSDNIRIKDNQKYLEPLHLEFLDNHILKRMRATNFQKDSDIERIKKGLSIVPYYEYPAEYFQKAGYPTTGGWYQPWDNRIVRNTGVQTIKVLPHEYRHLIDQYFPLNNYNKIYLNRAYKDYFTNQDLTLKDGFEDDLSDEMVTTNLDARIQLFKGKRINYDGQEMGISYTPLNIQNQFIQEASTEEILNALELSNLYGKKFVQFLKNKGDKYIEEKMPHIKNALKKVPAVIPFGLMSYKLFNQNNQEQHKNGGFLFPNQAFSHKFEK